MSPVEDADGTLGGPESLALIVISGQFERVHYALVLAAAQAAIGNSCTVFFSLHACRALTRHPEDTAPGWATMMGEDGGTALEIDTAFRQRGVASFEELLQSAVDLGVRFMVCEMGLRALDIETTDLRDDVPLEVTGAVSFLASLPVNAPVLVL